MAEFIVNPAEATTPIEVVCGNANAEIIRFTFDRNSDGVDLSGCAWTVTAKNSGGFSDVYMEGHGITNVSVSDTTISVDWALFGIAVGATGRTKYQLMGLQGKAIVKQFPYHTLNVLSYLESTLSTEAQEDISALWETIEYVGNQLPGILEAEAARKLAEAGRVNAENERVTAENARAAAEVTREQGEETRQNNEAERIQDETLRREAETERDDAEALRKNAEAARAAAEKNRAAAEDSRAEAESKRAADFANFDLTATRNGKVTTVTATNAQGKITVGEVMDGKDGNGLIINGLYATLDELKAAHPSASAGDAYSVGTSDSNEVYIWNEEAQEWQSLGPLQGPEGPQGAQGPQGEKGEKGDTGAAGKDGADAPQEAVLFVAQTLSASQKTQARTNLGLAAVAASGSYNDLSNTPTIPTSFDASAITSGTLGTARGGTGVTSNPSMLVNLGSTTAASVFATSPRPGVTGTLPLTNGGTGATTAAAARTALGLSTVASSGSYSDLSNKPTIPTVPSTYAASAITAGTLGGKVQANATATADVTAAQVRDIAASTTDLTAGTSELTSGQVYLFYE